MELDEIKKSWSELNQRLEKTEVLNKRLISEMLNTRHQSAKDKLMRFEITITGLCVFIAGFAIAMFFANIYVLSTVIIMEIVAVVFGVWQGYKIYLLNQMQLESCSTAELLKKAIRFKVVTRMKMIVGLIVVIPLIVVMVMLDKNLNNTAAIIGVIVGACVGLGIGLLLFFKKMKDIDSLIKSYKDLKDFDNE